MVNVSGNFLYVAEGDNFSNVENYKYQNGNCVKYMYINTIEGETVLEYSYENKFDGRKSPFYSCKNPKWSWLFIYNNLRTLSQNNIIEEKYSDGLNTEYITTWEYVYDSDGYPTKSIFIGYLGETWATEFKYKE